MHQGHLHTPQQNQSLKCFPAHYELDACEASLVPQKQLVSSICAWSVDATQLSHQEPGFIHKMHQGSHQTHAKDKYHAKCKGQHLNALSLRQHCCPNSSKKNRPSGPTVAAATVFKSTKRDSGADVQSVCMTASAGPRAASSSQCQTGSRGPGKVGLALR